MRMILTGLLVVFAAASLHAQSNSAASGGGSGTLPVESQMMTYEAINQLSHRIAADVGGKSSGQKILFASTANMTAISAFLAFQSAAGQLADAYTNADKANLNANTFLDAAPVISGLLTALKGSTTFSQSTFQQVDQALTSDLERDLNGHANLVVTAYPKSLAEGYGKIQSALDTIRAAREKAKDKVTADQLKALDTLLTNLQTSITDVSSNSVMPNILLGAALITSLGENYSVLTVSTDVAGGGSRADTYFLVNLLFPAPNPSYNGGAVVSYTLRSKEGIWQAGDTLRFVYKFTRLNKFSARFVSTAAGGV